MNLIIKIFIPIILLNQKFLAMNQIIIMKKQKIMMKEWEVVLILE